MWKKKVLLTLFAFFPVACSSPVQLATVQPAAQPKNPPKIEQEIKPVCYDKECFIRANPFWTPEEWYAFFDQTVYKQTIINALHRPSTSRPWYQFRQNNVSNSTIRNGVAFWKQNADALYRIEQEYGVPAEIIVAILGIETQYGRQMGSFRVVDSLTTLAFTQNDRMGYFQQELAEFIQICNAANKNPFSFKGSYAGAMGMPQFMPSSYQKWAKDGDGDGWSDIWHNPADAMASIAYYLKSHHWQTGGEWSIPVDVALTNEILDLAEQKTKMNHTAGELRAMGVDIPSRIANTEKVVLYRMEVAPNEFTYYIGLNNFYAIWQYNHSRQYVHAVMEIAQSIRSRMH